MASGPKHYTRLTPEPWDLIEAWGWDKEFNLASALEYMARAGHKLPAPDPDDNGESYAVAKLKAREADINKAIAYLQRDAAQTRRKYLDAHGAV